MHKIYLTLILSSLITTSAFAACPSNRPAKWMDDKCYTCETVAKKIQSFKGIRKEVKISKNPTQKQIREFKKGLQEIQTLTDTINNIKKVCTEPAKK